MDTLQIIAPLIGVVLGGAISGLGAQFIARKERRRILAVALADLLEVRHRMMSFDLVLEKLRSEFNLGPESFPILRNLFDTLAPLDASFTERYNGAISLLAGVDPVLAFTLRSKNDLPKLLGTLRALATSDGANPALYEDFESTLRAAAAPSLNEAVMGLASAHSFVTAFKVRRLIKRSETLPPEASKFLEQLKTMKPSPELKAAHHA